jgi:hypothetical protein
MFQDIIGESPIDSKNIRFTKYQIESFIAFQDRGYTDEKIRIYFNWNKDVFSKLANYCRSEPFKTYRKNKTETMLLKAMKEMEDKILKEFKEKSSGDSVIINVSGNNTGNINVKSDTTNAGNNTKEETKPKTFKDLFKEYYQYIAWSATILAASLAYWRFFYNQ